MRFNTNNPRKRKKVALIVWICTLITVNSVLYYFLIDLHGSMKNNTWMEVPLDVDRLDDNTILITSTPILTQTPFIKLYDNTSSGIMHRVYEINNNGEIQWEITNLSFPHEIEKINLSNDDFYLIADTGFDAVKLFNESLEQIWEFNPKYINWTQIVPEWGRDSYFMNPIDEDWTHINDVDFISREQSGENYDSLLISIRNFDLILILNFTAEFSELMEGDSIGSINNIIWWYGPGVLSHQHNPDQLPNGNIIVCDSENNRILEINKTSKQIETIIDNAAGSKFSWPRDVDYNSEKERYLITDSGNNRIVEVDKYGEVYWEWVKNLALPYEADYLENGDIFISGSVSGYIMEVDYTTNEILWYYNANEGKDYFLISFQLNCILLLLVFSPLSISYWKKIQKYHQIHRKLKISEKFGGLVSISISILALAGLIFSRSIIYGSYYALLIITTMGNY